MLRTRAAGPELHPALEPADHLAVRQECGHHFEQLGLVGEALGHGLGSIRGEESCDLRPS